jgi:hypothetical protein
MTIANVMDGMVTKVTQEAMRTEMLLYFPGINFFCHLIDTEIECILYLAHFSRAGDIQVHNVWKERDDPLV